MTIEQLRVHRELEYLRAAAWAHPRRRLPARELEQRRARVEERYRRLLWVERRAAGAR